MEQFELSLTRLIKYAFRYILVVVLCVAIGLGGGVLLAMNKEPANYEKYTARLTFDITQYVHATSGSVLVSEGNYHLHARQLAQIVETACGSEVAAQTFDALKNVLYENGSKMEDSKSETFYGDLEVKLATDAFTVSFVYDVANDADRAEALKVLETYLSFAKAAVVEKYPEFATEAYANVISAGEIKQDFDMADEYIKANTEEGVLGNALLGAIVGGLLSAVIIFVGYFFDPRIKSVSELLPEEKSSVLVADKEDAMLSFAACLKASNAKKLLLAAPEKDEKFSDFAERVQAYLAQTGANVKTICVDTQNAAWFTQLDEIEKTEGYVLCLCNGAGNEVLSCLAAKTEVAALFVDQKAVMAKRLQAAVNGIEDNTYLCTVLHNVGRAYLD